MSPTAATASATLLSSDEQAAAEAIAAYLGQRKVKLSSGIAPGIVDWAHRDYFIPETNYKIRLQPVQKCFLRYGFENPNQEFTTYLYSTIKKSGKSAIAGLVGRYKAEFSGPKAEIYYIANSKDQAKDRSYESALTSLELSPGFNRDKRELPGKWKIVVREATHIPTDSFMRAIATDYEGAAGGNPTATFFTELWSFTSERMKRLWDELTPVPTRRSIRYVETYAGFKDESEILWGLYKTAVEEGRRLTVADLESVCGAGCWPYVDDPPFYINEKARTFAYWDQGVAARRMPWQTPDYYIEQETSLRPEAFSRLHMNLWQSSTQQFLPVIWWNNCAAPLGAAALPGAGEPVVMGVDASVSGDCTAVVLVRRDASDPEKHVRVVESHVWYPPKGGAIDFAVVKDTILDCCSRYNVVQLSYDAYQLHQMTQELVRDGVVWCKQFSQAAPREVADKQLYDMIRNRKLLHNDEIPAYFIENCSAYVQGDSTKIERLRIVKSGKDRPVDPIVALSMATYECMRLILT